MTAAFAKTDLTFHDGGFKITTITITPLTDEARKFLNVDPTVKSVIYRKTVGLDKIADAERSGLFVEAV